jgi:hypothetical protein
MLSEELLLSSDTFIKNPDGSEYIGQVWPGYTVRDTSSLNLIRVCFCSLYNA